MSMLHAPSEHLEQGFGSSAAFLMAKGGQRRGRRNGGVGAKQMELSEEVSIVAMTGP